jgi:hypothetical protein
MPAKPPWLLMIPAILEHLEAFDAPVVDRAGMERLFGLRRRRAIELMHGFGGYQAGRTFLIDRRQLIERLRSLAEGEDFLAESRRKERLAEKIDQLQRQHSGARVRIAVRPDALNCKMAQLGPGVELEAGHLHVRFTGAEDLLSKLFELSQAAANDFDRFREIADAGAQRA